MFIETILSDDETSTASREASPYAESPQSGRVGSESPNETTIGNGNNSNSTSSGTNTIAIIPNQAINNSIMPSNARYASVATSTTTTSNNHLTSSSIACMNSITNIKGKSRKVNIIFFS